MFVKTRTSHGREKLAATLPGGFPWVNGFTDQGPAKATRRAVCESPRDTAKTQDHKWQTSLMALPRKGAGQSKFAAFCAAQ
ncbi:MAG: hypothetical protein WBW81_11160 [Methylocella sp.]